MRTGPSISNRLTALTLWLGSLLQGSASGDVARLGGEQHQLSGQLRAIDAAGIIEWTSPLSPEPLKLRSDKLEAIEFSAPASALDEAPILLTLRNGDSLPISAIEQIQDRQLGLLTAVAGRINVPRNVIEVMQFGPREDKIVYEGPGNLREWLEDGGEADNWEFNGNSLCSSGNSLAARRFELPTDFVLFFNAAWGKGRTNFSATFADPLAGNGKPADRYRFLYGDAGMRIERQMAQDNRTVVLAQCARRPPQTQGNTSNLAVEIRVWRSTGRLELLINGRTEGIIGDPHGNIPSGGGVTLANQSGTAMVFSGIRIAGNHANSLSRHLKQDRGDSALDSLITTDEDRWSGQLLTISSTGQTQLRFKTQVDKNPWEIPQSEVATLFFAQTDLPKDQARPATFRVELHQEGVLSLGSVRVDQQILSGEHPWLGPVRIPLGSVRSLARIGSTAKPAKPAGGEEDDDESSNLPIP